MKTLKIAILSKMPTPTVNNELVPVLLDRGHLVSMIDLSIVPLKDFLEHPLIQQLLDMDVIYYRTGLSPELAGMLEVYLRSQNKTLVNMHFSTHPFAHSKCYETVVAAKHGFIVPQTLYSPNSSYDQVAATIGEPFVAKPNAGARGENVQLVESEEDWDEIHKIDTSEYIFQEFVPHDFEYRVHVIDGEVKCMWKKSPSSGDFRSNEAQGGSMIRCDLEYKEELTRLTTGISEIFGFEIMVVDFMLHRGTGVFYFTEINLNPGWSSSCNEVTIVDRSTAAAEYFERVAN